jgi:DNA-binding beta-propeller fold protein YncE
MTSLLFSEQLKVILAMQLMKHLSHRFIHLPLFAALLLSLSLHGQQYNFEWHIGPKNQSAIAFERPEAIAANSQGDVYIVDYIKNRIIKCNSFGEIRLTFGTGGSADGQFNSPSDVAVDKQGNVYVADNLNYRIQKFDANGNFLSKFSLQGTPDPHYRNLSGVAVDGAGNVYASSNNAVQKFDANGNFLFKIGGPTAGTANGQFSYPSDIAVDGQDNIYVVDAYNDRIQKFAKNGNFLMKFGSGGYERGQFYSPSGVAVDTEGTIYVVARYGGAGPVQMFNPDGTFQKIHMSYTPGEGALISPYSIALSGQNNVYLSDREKSYIQKFTYGYLMWKVDGGSDGGQFRSPSGLSLDTQGNVYVADYGNHRIQKFNNQGAFLTKFGSGGSNTYGAYGQFTYPSDVAVDEHGNVYVSEDSRIQILTTDGRYSVFGSYGKGDGQLDRVTGIAVDKQGNIYVTEANNGRLQKFDAKGQFIWKRGGTGTEMLFSQPMDVSVDVQGNVYVVDYYRYNVQKFDPNGQLLLSFGEPGVENGRFDHPCGVAVDAQGNIYVADHSNYRVQVFTPKGEFLTAFGTAGTGEGKFSGPRGIAVDAQGNVYVSDSRNNSLQKFTYVPALVVPKVVVKYTTEPIDDNTGSFYFGSTIAGTPVTLGFILDNTEGTVDLNVSGFSLPAGFTLVGEFPTRVPAGESVPFRVQLTAIQAGTYTGNLSFATNDPNKNPYNFTISGQVAANPLAERLSQRITFEALPNKTYGDDAFALLATATSDLPVSFSVLSGPAILDGNTLTLVGAGSVTLKAVQAGNDTYKAATDVVQTFNINKASQAITFEPLADKMESDTPFNLSAEASSGLPVTFSIVSGPATLAANTLTLTGSGVVRVKATQAGDANYEPALEVFQSFNVTAATVKSNQRITFAVIEDKTFGDASFALTAAASSGLPVTFSVISGPAVVSGNTLLLTGAGTVTIQATQWGNEMYHAAATVKRTFTVHQASQVITLAALADKTSGDAPFRVSGLASSGLPLSFTVVSGPATIDNDMLTITGTGVVNLAATQAGNADYLAAQTVTGSFCVAPAKPSISANGIFLTSSSSEGNQWYLDGDLISGAEGQTFNATVAGSYTVQVTGPCGPAVHSDPFQITVSGTEEGLATQVQLFPNPATTKVIVLLPAGWHCKQAAVYDATGNQVARMDVDSKAVTQISFNTAALAQGMYLIRIETSKGIIVKKFLKE